MNSERLFAELYPKLIAAVKAGGDGIQIERSDTIAPSDRIAAYALAKVIGVKLTDLNPALPPDPLGTLPSVEREARAYIARVDPARLPARRAVRLAPLVAWKLLHAAWVTAPWLFASLLFACIGFGLGATFGFLWTVLATVVAFIATGIMLFLAAIWDGLVWAVRNPGEVWTDFRWLCCALAIVIPFWAYVIWAEESARRQRQPAMPLDRGYGSSAIGNFRETSAFGDAQLAGWEPIEPALQGHAVDHAPTFRE